MADMTLRIGFVPLIDAAPLMIAKELGYFAEEGLTVSLHRQIGWANIRDKLCFGHLDACHALLGMPVVSQLDRDSFREPVIALMALGIGGNAITVRKELHDLGVRSAIDLAELMKNETITTKPMVGHVFGASMHHYLLREWLFSAEIDPDKDVRLCVIPPPQMPEHMKGGYVDLFCVGEPWNTMATRQGYGVAILATTDILPNHPEKVLAVTQRFAREHGDQMEPLVRAVLRGCIWCAEERNRTRLTEILSQPQYLAQDAELLRESLDIDREFGSHKYQKSARPAEWKLRSFAAELMFPSKMHPAWFMQQMIRWGHLNAETDVAGIAAKCTDTAAYRKAAASLGLACPEEDFAPMELRAGRMLTLSGLEKVRARNKAAWKRETRGLVPNVS